jgi:uncharacterized membrane protein YkoI
MFSAMTQPSPHWLTLAAVAAFGAPAQAGDKTSDHEAARAALSRHEILPLTRILTIVESRVPGDVLKVKLEEDKGRMIYELKVLGVNGRVREVEIDAKNGAVLKVEDD